MAASYARRRITPVRPGGASKGVKHTPTSADDNPGKVELAAIAALKKSDTKGWIRACQEYVLKNRGLAVTFAQEHAKDPRKPAEDLINAALAGLMCAVREFDVTKSNRFSSFAVWKMLDHCQRFAKMYMRSTNTLLCATREEEMCRLEYLEAVSSLPEDASDEDVLTALQKKEEELQKKAIERNVRPRKPRWSGREGKDRLRLAKNSIPSGWANLDPERDSEPSQDLESSLDVGAALATMPAVYREHIAYCYGVGHLRRDYQPHESPLVREIQDVRALKTLRRVLGLQPADWEKINALPPAGGDSCPWCGCDTQECICDA